MRKRFRHFPTLPIAVLLLLALACGPSLRKRYEEELAEAPPAAKHAVQSERLRVAMHQLRQVSAERLPQEMDSAAAGRERARVVATLAREIAASAEQIPEVLADVEMGEEARREFRGLAGELAERALKLAAEAEHAPAEELEARLHDVDAACAACHSRFRVLPRIR